MDNSLYIFKMSKYRDCSLSDINSGVAFSRPTEPTKPGTFSIFPQLTDTRNCVKMSENLKKNAHLTNSNLHF